MNGPTLASQMFCWLLERGDGFGLALTSHDEAVDRDGVRYEPAPGMTPSAIKREMGLEPSSGEVAGVLTSAAISEADLVAGRWDGASMTLFAANWQDPAEPARPLLRGRLGSIQAKGGEFSADLLGAAAQLSKPVCPQTSPECRAELGDRSCRVDMAGRSLRTVVTGQFGMTLTLDRPVSDDFRFGTLRAVTGPERGLSHVIIAVEGNEVTLRGAAFPQFESGTAVIIREGCDKRLDTCAARFGNAANFRGEPHLPGNDLLTRYPGG